MIIVVDLGHKASKQTNNVWCISRILSVFEPSNRSENCLVSFWPLNDELYAATESNVTYRVDPETLESMDRVHIHFYFVCHWF